MRPRGPGNEDVSLSAATSYPGSYLRTPSSYGKTLVGAGHVTPQNLGCFQLAF